MPTHVQQLLDENSKNGELAVLFYAPWFAPSVEVKNELEERKLIERLLILDVDQHVDLVEELELLNVPVLYVFRDGEIVDKRIGKDDCLLVE